MTKGSHFLSRTFTRPWELPNRELVYYDFKTDTLGKGPSKNLFVVSDPDIAPLEDFFNRTVETPLNDIRTLLEKKNLLIPDPKKYRALYLVFAIQTLRYSSVKIEGQKQPLKDFSLWSETKFNQLVAVMQSRFKLAGIKVPRGRFLFHPETGVFQVPVMDAKLSYVFEKAWAMPISPDSGLVLMPTNFSKAWMDILLGSFHIYSVGVNEYQSKILVPPILYENMKHDELRSMIKEMRRSVIETISAAEQMTLLAANLFKELGLELPRT